MRTDPAARPVPARWIRESAARAGRGVPSDARRRGAGWRSPRWP